MIWLDAPGPPGAGVACVRSAMGRGTVHAASATVTPSTASLVTAACLIDSLPEGSTDLGWRSNSGTIAASFATRRQAWLDHEGAAVDVERLTSDERGGVGGQECNCHGDLVRCAKATQRDGANQAGF